MHTFSETGAGVPAFLAKLWRLVDDPDTNNLICWSKDGRSFIIQNQAQFARELLPLNYKHNNMASFIRQLNMYGFHKITSIDNGGLKFDRDEMEFSHPCFKRNCPYLLEHIKRKIANTKSLDDKSAVKPEAVSKVLQDVKAMRGRQDSLDTRFSVMKQENEALWREIASLRQKHAKQQQIVNKLIQFLITIVQPSRNMTSVKRHMQLMINDTPENAKLRKTSESESDCGPVIHELGEELLDEVENELDMIDSNSPYAASNTHTEHEPTSPHNIERPLSSISMISQNYDYSNQSAEDVLNFCAAATTTTTDAKKAVNTAAGGTATRTVSGNASPSIIQSVNADGSKIVYHVTEVPDAHPNEDGGGGGGITTSAANAASASPTYFTDDDNVLQTPLVRKEMARSQLLKLKNKQRRHNNNVAAQSTGNVNAAAAVKDDGRTNITNTISNNNAPTSAKQLRRGKPAVAALQQSIIHHEPIHIKSEQHEIDPMLFLNVYADNQAQSSGIISSDANLISPNRSEDSRPSSVNSTRLLAATSTSTNGGTLGGGGGGEDGHNSTSGDMYNSQDFIVTGDSMPTDIFEDNSLIGNTITESYKNTTNATPTATQQLQQQQFGRNTAASGKFSSFLVGGAGGGGNSYGNGASTSAAAAAAAAAVAAASSGGGGSGGIVANRTLGGKNGGNAMAVTKYNKNGSIVGINEHRLSTSDEVHGHLDNMQDELDTLKDLLRGENYSLDANTLLGPGAGNSATLNNNNNRIYLSSPLDGDFFNKLFNDSDILGPYGLSLSSENTADKKGSELMTYQPIYDLSDIMDINDKDDPNNVASSSNARQLQTQGSMLNTPYHE